jgi:protein-S-isoprenylcysteine O-methyltransferase Ste14
MAYLALVFYIVFIALTFGLKTYVQLKRTGSTGFHGVSGRPGSVEWFSGVGFAAALIAGLTAPVLVITGVLEPLAVLDSTGVQAAGVLLAVSGCVLTLISQMAMGDSWRIGVDPDEKTELVTDGAFRVVRNPVFAAMVPAAVGLALMVPNPVALVGAAGLVTAVEIQVRAIEEPYLIRTHAAAYREYAARVGRFFPGIGRIN